VLSFKLQPITAEHSLSRLTTSAILSLLATPLWFLSAWLSTDGYVVSVTDNQSNLYLAVDPIQVGVTSTQTWVCYGARGGPCSVMATLSAFQSGAAIKLAEISGLSGALDVSLTLNGTTANPIVGPITTGNANDMLIGLERGATPSAVGAGWTETDTQAVAAISPTNLPKVDSNVQLMYHFDEGDGIVAYDASGNHLNAFFSISQ
jgi:hypothetical protein